MCDHPLDSSTLAIAFSAATFERRPELACSGSSARPAGSRVTFRSVGFRYGHGGRDVLHDVSFEAPAGKVTALVGPSGAGKTTLMQLVPQLWDAMRGAVELGGVNVRELSEHELTSSVSMVFQDVFLFHGTVRENRLLGKPGASHAELEAACRAARADDFIRSLPQHHETLLGERGARLSRGEKQRLSIARALLRGASVLLLDEATAFADPENEARIQEALSELCTGRTVLVVAHRLSSITSADQIVVLDAGRVQDRGTHEDLLARCELYQRLWRSQTDALEWSFNAGAASPARAEVA